MKKILATILAACLLMSVSAFAGAEGLVFGFTVTTNNNHISCLNFRYRFITSIVILRISKYPASSRRGKWRHPDHL